MQNEERCTVEVLRRALELLKAGETPALATVIRASGSTPRRAGAKMLVMADGSTFGTVGGGRIELAVTEAAMAVADGAPACRIQRHLSRDLAMCCGGEMEVHVEPAAPAHDLLAEVLRAHDRRVPCTLMTSLDGGRSTVTMDGEAAHERGLGGDFFVQSILPSPRLILFGAGHVARAIGPLAAGVGFEVTVCDESEVEAPSLVWAAAEIDSFDLRDVESKMGALGTADYIIITTRDHSIDQRVLESVVLNESLLYIGVIGSRAKAKRFRTRLEAKGLLTPERWARVHSPMGLDIGAQTPAEIAISVVAELVRVRGA